MRRPRRQRQGRPDRLDGILTMDAIAIMAEALRRRGVNVNIIRAAATEARALCPPPQPPAQARPRIRKSRWVGSVERARQEDEAEQARQRRGSVGFGFV